MLWYVSVRRCRCPSGRAVTGRVPLHRGPGHTVMLPHGLLDIEQHALTRNTPKRTPLRAAGSPQAGRRAAPSSPTPRAPPAWPCPCPAPPRGPYRCPPPPRQTPPAGCPPSWERRPHVPPAAGSGGRRPAGASGCGARGPPVAVVLPGPVTRGVCVCVWQPALGEPCHLTATLGVGLHSETFPFSSAHFNSFPNKNVNFFLSL